MSFWVRGENPGHSTPADGGDLADFPAATPETAQGADWSRLALVRPLVPLAVAFSLGIALAPALPFGSAWWAGGAVVLLLLGALA
ncbi:MAG: hypothetical protein WCI75_12255, partial [candidate division NC10 bacterium]